jgi:hypothetical protein
MVPLLATLLPIDSLDDSIALINILATIAAINLQSRMLPKM